MATNSDPIAAAAFADVVADEIDAKLARNDKGRVLASLPNVFLILSAHPEWAGVIAYNEFAATVEKRTAPPWDRPELGEWSDMDDARLSLWLGQKYGIEPRDLTLAKAVFNAAECNRYHPVREYLDALVWDQKPRLAYWLQAYCGARLREDEKDKPADETYLGLVGSKFLIGAVTRIFQPGCKFDSVLILEGPQEIGKSTVMRVMSAPWFTDAAVRLGDKETYEIMRGHWWLEMAELDALSRSDNTQAKSFFSRSEDRFRNVYGRRAVTVKRQQVFAGTTNHRQYLRDPTGGRRYWPAWCERIDLDALREDRDQLWAEAVAQYRAGVRPYVTDDAQRQLLRDEQDKRYIGDAYEARIRAWLDDSVDGARRMQVTTGDVLGGALRLDSSKWNLAEQMRVGHIMERIGWPRRRGEKLEDGTRPWMYYRPEVQ